MVLNIMPKNNNKEGVKYLVTMESREKPGVLRHAFVLVTRVYKT